MIYEVAEIEVRSGQEAAFERAVAEAAPVFRRARGCRSLALQKVLERPSTYRLVVGWETVEDHMVHFRNSDDFQEWRRLAGPHFATAPKVDHAEYVLRAFEQ